MSLTIVADENIPAVAHFLAGFGEVRCVNGRALVREQLEDVDVLLVRSVTRVDQALLEGTPVRFVGTATSGFDHIDRDYLAQHAMGFAHAPGSNANSVVEYVLAAIAAIEDKLEQLLAGGSVGIVGYGVIGRAVAARLAALGIRHFVYDPWLAQDTITYASGLDEVLDCDVITLHAELTRQQPWPSFHLLGEAELQRMRGGTLLINASRGPVVDNKALLTQLDSGRGPQAVLDVWEGEPNLNPDLLQRAILGTAHIAGYSLDGKVLATRMLSQALAASLQLVAPNMQSPVGDAPTIMAPPKSSSAELVRYLLRARYDIGQDDRLLREAVFDAGPLHTRGKRFDQLRKSYRDRRELAGSSVEGVSAAQRPLVRALGCIPVPHGNPL